MAEFKDFRDEQLLSILKLCNNHMQFDSLSETILREKVVDDPDFDSDLVLTLWEGSDIVGFLSAVIRKVEHLKSGFIKLFVVKENYRKQGLGNLLYDEIEKRFKERDVFSVRVCEAPFNYLVPGIDQRYIDAIRFFEKKGFQKFSEVTNLTVDLSNQEFNTEAQEESFAKEKIEISRADYMDMLDVIKFVDEQFPVWHTEVANTYNSLPVSLHIARKSGKIRAFAAHNSNNFGSGYFGPNGTHKELRGKGVGTVLLKRCLQDIKDWGLTQAIIPWTGPGSFFENAVNAKIERTFWRYEKQIMT